MVRLADRPAMTISGDLGRKATKQTKTVFMTYKYRLIQIIIRLFQKIPFFFKYSILLFACLVEVLRPSQ